MDPYDARDCSTCPINCYCAGGADIQLNPGFWRASNESDYILDCNQFSTFCL